MELNASGLPATPYDEGYLAFIRREHYNTNPHIENTTEADDWDQGWGDAERDHPHQFDHAAEAFTS